MCWPLSRNFPFAGLLVLPSFLEAISGVTEVLKRTAEAKKENRLWCGSKWKKFQWNWMENTEGGKKMTHLWKERNDSICFSRCCWRAVVGGSWDLDAFDPNIQLILRKLREIELEVCAAKAYEPQFRPPFWTNYKHDGMVKAAEYRWLRLPRVLSWREEGRGGSVGGGIKSMGLTLISHENTRRKRLVSLTQKIKKNTFPFQSALHDRQCRGTICFWHWCYRQTKMGILSSIFAYTTHSK